MNRDFKILVANMRKMDGTQHSTMNDTEFSDYSIMLVTEPYLFRNQDGEFTTVPQAYAHWTPTLPNACSTEERPRAMIWTHKNIKVNPIKSTHGDLAGVLVKTNGRAILAISVYVPAKTSSEDEELQVRLDQIRSLVAETRRNHSEPVELIIGGDFNRHDQLWGGDEVARTIRQGEGEAIIQLMADLDLQSLLPRGTPTWHSDNGEFQSTIDLVMATPELVSELSWCNTEGPEHGSDHQIIRTAFHTEVDIKAMPPRRLWKKADWSQIGKGLEQALKTRPQPEKPEDVDDYWSYIQELMTPLMERYVPLAKPSPYAKRWWTEDLSQLRRDYTYWRNKLTKVRRNGLRDPHFTEMAKTYKKRFHDAMRNQRKTHWQDFIADAKNIWTVSRYLDPSKGSSFSQIPALRNNDDRLVSSEPELAQTLLDEFFKPPPEVSTDRQDGTNEDAGRDELPMEPVTEAEVQRAVFAASPYKAPGIDDIPAVVWQKAWPTLKHHIVNLFQLSISKASIPQAWKTAKIIPLRKPKKPNYTLAKAYRPISLLSTLGKMLEALVAERISYLVETYNLLPKNHFGARKCRSTTQALTVIQEYIYHAWRHKKVLSLVSFDLKGAYNGVNTDVLLQRLRTRRVPAVLRDWIANFCQQRKASVMVNGVVSGITNLSQAGLPQGSPLSPILFLFFNAGLVSSKLNQNQGAVAFVDDYTAWVTGVNAEENTRIIQETIIPKAASWAKASGATFEADKTAFIHFTRNKNKLSETKLQMDNEEIPPVEEVKVLGVVLPQDLRFREHAARAVKRGVNAALALKRIKGMPPKTTRQLFQATVAPTLDYASPIWSTRLSASMTRMLNQAQRIGAQAIIGAFRTVSLERAEMEASISPIAQRFKEQQDKFWVKSHTLPEKHPFWKIHSLIDTGCKRFESPLQRIAAGMETCDLSDMEKIEAFCRPPWQKSVPISIPNKEEAKKWAETSPELKIFVDASYRKGKVGIGMFHPTGNNQEGFRISRKIGHCEGLTATYGETLAIEQAIDFICESGYIQNRPRNVTESTTYVVVSDSQTAIQQIGNPRNQSGQAIVRRIYLKLHNLELKQGLTVRLQWVPAHTMVIGDEVADQLAKRATEGELEEIKGLTITSALKKMKDAWKTNDTTSKYTIDSALPGNHTKSLYDERPYNEAAILCQLRTGKSRLNEYLAKIQAVESSQCECTGNASETVRHFLFECSRWDQHREKLKEVAGDRWGDLSFFLGGRTERKKPSGELLDGPRKSWEPDIDIVNRTIEFAIATGRLSQ